ncbi:MAG: hypothetical protein ACI814_005082 [Mariniblastus sp.]|jgi:hypothetical protein
MDPLMANPKTTQRIDAISAPTNVAWVAFIWLVAAVAIAVLPQEASAQSGRKLYSELDVSDKFRAELPRYNATAEEKSATKRTSRNAEKAQREAFLKVETILESGGNIGDPAVTEYLNDYLFPSMTTLDNRVLSTLGDARTKFIKDFLSEDVTGNTRSGFIDLTISGMEKTYSNPKLHPAARLNAVYLIGMLDQVPQTRNPPLMPVPSRAGFTNLLKIISNSTDTDTFPPELKVAALAGIQRHLELDKTTGGAALVTMLTTMLNDPKTDDLSYWLKRRSMQMLGMIGNPSSLDNALTIIESEEAQFWLKFDALQAIGKLNTGADAAKSLAASMTVTNFIANSLDEESKTIQGRVDKLVYDQLLFQDIDLIETGTHYTSGDDAAADEGDDMGGMGGMGRGGGGGSPGGMGRGGGGGAPGGMGMGRGGGGMGFEGGDTTEPTLPLLELPVYQLNLTRRRVKALAFVGSDVLGGKTGTAGLASRADEKGKSFIKKVVRNLDTLIADSNVGIIDLDDRSRDDEEESDEEPVAVTTQLIELCADSAKILDGYVRAEKGLPAAAAPKADAAAPADAEGFAPGS